MYIKFQRYLFTLEFERSVNFIAPPSFFFRSLIGKELRYISCVLKTQKCPQCPLKGRCAYSIIFEVPIEKDNIYLAGRSNATPPFTLNMAYNIRTSLKILDVTLTLIGKAVEYAPYIILAFLRAGESGLFKERVKYRIVKTECNNIEINPDVPSLDNIEPYIFNLDAELNCQTGKPLKIKFLSPFRYKKNGNYTSDINFSDVILATVRRLNCLSGFYGDGALIEYTPGEVKSERKLYWKEESRYSARQKESMLFGGVMGEMLLLENIEPLAFSLLNGAQIFNIGKNVAFGLGNLSITEVT
jgi:hypothetical protein